MLKVTSKAPIQDRAMAIVRLADCPSPWPLPLRPHPCAGTSFHAGTVVMRLYVMGRIQQLTRG